MKGLEIVFDIVTKNQGIIEQYNMHLHALRFKPHTILNRMDAIQFSISFIRFCIYMKYICQVLQFNMIYPL
jgi:hypothetical protein